MKILKKKIVMFCLFALISAGVAHAEGTTPTGLEAALTVDASTWAIILATMTAGVGLLFGAKIFRFGARFVQSIFR